MVKAKKPEENAAASGSSRTRKDSDKPKKALSAYFIWLKENRSNIAEPGMAVTEVTKKAGAIWRGMTADDKKKWEKKAQEDKGRYAQEMADYNGGARK